MYGITGFLIPDTAKLLWASDVLLEDYCVHFSSPQPSTIKYSPETVLDISWALCGCLENKTRLWLNSTFQFISCCESQNGERLAISCLVLSAIHIYDNHHGYAQTTMSCSAWFVLCFTTTIIWLLIVITSSASSSWSWIPKGYPWFSLRHQMPKPWECIAGFHPHKLLDICDMISLAQSTGFVERYRLKVRYLCK